jgi:hypothetical protein
MGKPSKQVMEFMETYGVASDEIWEVHGSQWVVKHKALERVAAEKGITFDRPAIIEHDTAAKIAVVCVFAKMGDREEWSFGEASPANNKNAYIFSMAEKRGKDRCILKLLNTHGALYSEDEADDFAKPRANPHVTRAEDITDHQTEYDDNGQPVDNIPLSKDPPPKMKVKDARPEFAALVAEMEECTSTVKLERWGKLAADTIAALSPEWQKIMRGKYADKLKSLREEVAA